MVGNLADKYQTKMTINLEVSMIIWTINEKSILLKLVTVLFYAVIFKGDMDNNRNITNPIFASLELGLQIDEQKSGEIKKNHQ